MFKLKKIGTARSIVESLIHYTEVLAIIKNQFAAAGETRCNFSWDAQGSLLAAVGIKDT
jgi:hypothetical protein